MPKSITGARGLGLAAIAAALGLAGPLLMSTGAEAKAGDQKTLGTITAISPTAVTLSGGKTFTITARTQLDGFAPGVRPKVGDCVKVTDRLPIDGVAHEIDNEPGNCR
jgi:Domain of unknown function (DUF5666)